MILALACYLVSPRATTPQEQWLSFYPWLGPVPRQVQAEEWDTDTTSHQGVIFTFFSTEEWRAKTIRSFGLENKDRDTAPPCPGIGRSSFTPSSPG